MGNLGRSGDVWPFMVRVSGRNGVRFEFKHEHEQRDEPNWLNLVGRTGQMRAFPGLRTPFSTHFSVLPLSSESSQWSDMR